MPLFGILNCNIELFTPKASMLHTIRVPVAPGRKSGLRNISAKNLTFHILAPFILTRDMANAVYQLACILLYSEYQFTLFIVNLFYMHLSIKLRSL
jgi:hypothetical protein